ncbi:hypothetical protein EsDP_00007060 [Epichloe bromicola]|uniref:Uncharacterized protein n=1 Tax=Epichloe bromicola TaxID=79588 RepID=A0ABQ0CZF7_9HYPO
MQLTTLILAVLPALAFADTSSAIGSAPATGNVTSMFTITTKLVKTVTLSRAHTVVTSVTSTWSHNSTTYMPTGGMTSVFTSPAVTTAPGPEPTIKGPVNAAGALDATKVALAGVVGMLAVVLM